MEREGMQAGGQLDTCCGDLQTNVPEPDARGKMIRRLLIVKCSLTYEDVADQ